MIVVGIVSACSISTPEPSPVAIPTPAPRVTFALAGNTADQSTVVAIAAATEVPTDTPLPTETATAAAATDTATPEATVAVEAAASDSAAQSDTQAVSDTQTVSTTAGVTNSAVISDSTPLTTTAAVTTTTVATTTVAAETQPHVFFRQPSNNATVPLTSTVIMSATGLTIAPAGEVVEGAGHFHILVDTDFVEPGVVIPKDEQHLHFGDGATQAEVGLTAGSHILRLQFADGAHTALAGDQYRAEIVVGAVDGAPEQAVHFVMPRDGAVTPPQVDVEMAAAGLVVEPAGAVSEGAGHFHVLVDTDFIEPGTVIPKDEQHLHFGSGQLTTTLELAPGEHTLRLQFADGAHTALAGDQYRDTIQINVVDGAPARQVQFAAPRNGTEVSSPVAIQMTAAGLIVEPAGAVLRAEDDAQPGGHMHILVDADFVPPGEVIPKDEQHLHFGAGQLQTELELTSGVHILRLQMANGAHIALDGQQYRDEISITVK
ncbi:MAG: DUF4399 domain-containing protein [Caldilineaceae bacterium]|nr:DUF4399 domain-containing protein [Caldilineaceae bacterium]